MEERTMAFTKDRIRELCTGLEDAGKRAVALAYAGDNSEAQEDALVAFFDLDTSAQRVLIADYVTKLAHWRQSGETGKLDREVSKMYQKHTMNGASGESFYKVAEAKGLEYVLAFKRQLERAKRT